ncbi:MAG: magnesium chelatase, partial [Cytophagales bacterium]
ERYTEKLATPDVSVADLIGDVDPIKAATLKLPYSDERVIHYGLIPRSNRCLFVINELPDLQARIQVSLFNILQEGDIQIRGFKLRLPLDIQFVFTANPEDYTNRGSIITPLKDRIDSQIITHYPKTRDISKKISQQEISKSECSDSIKIHPVLSDLCEQIAIEARKSEYVDHKSGVSARMTIAILESLVAASELRMLKNKEQNTFARITDVWNVIPAITGKIELVYEGEQEGALIVSQNLIGKAIRTVFEEHFTNPETEKKTKKSSIYQPTIDWFREGNHIELGSFDSNEALNNKLYQIPGLYEIALEKFPQLPKNELLVFMELILFGLAECSLISRQSNDGRFQFKDLLDSMFKGFSDEDFEEDDQN